MTDIREIAIVRLKSVISGTDDEIRGVEAVAWGQGDNYPRIIRGLLKGLSIEEAIERCNIQIVHDEMLSDEEDQYTVEGATVCPKCKGRRVRFIEKQTRSADEALTQFNKCVECKFRWKF
jgi:DNA-directed RNA polymerase subunit M/transcription elongation factor TFIIS